MVTQWARAHFAAGWNVVLGFQPAAPAGNVVLTTPAKAPKLSLLDRLDRWFWRQEQQRRERYLAEAVDVVDLEQRMRGLERAPSRVL